MLISRLYLSQKITRNSKFHKISYSAGKEIHLKRFLGEATTKSKQYQLNRQLFP